MLNVFVLFYVTAACGLPGWLAGIALGAGLVVDAVMEPLIGSLTDGWRSRYGRRVPFMVAGLLPTLVTFNLIFALPSGIGDITLFLWLMLLIGFITHFVVDLYLALPGARRGLSDDYAERSSIAAWRWGIGILGTVAVIGLGYGVFLKGPDSLSNRASYLPLTLSLSLILVAGALIAIRTGLVTRHRQHETVAPSAAIHVRLLGEVREVFRNPTFRILFGSMLLFNISAGVSQALGLHLGTFFWRLESGQLQGLATAAVIGLALGAPLAGPLGSRIEKRTMLIIGKTGMFICNAVPVTLKLLGLLTLTGSALTVFLATTAFLSGAAMGLSIIAFLSIVADAADEHEYLFGTRREGLYFAGWSFAAKSATGAGLLIAGVVLQLIDFPTNLAEQGATAATVLPERTVTWLGIAGGPGGALLSVVAIAMILLYRLDKRTHARILAELNARRHL